jgi:hypothetical protein
VVQGEFQGCNARDESLHTPAGILQRDISSNNLMVNESNASVLFGKKEGIISLYGGLTLHLLRAVPSAAIHTWSV